MKSTDLRMAIEYANVNENVRNAFDGDQKRIDLDAYVGNVNENGFESEILNADEILIRIEPVMMK